MKKFYRIFVYLLISLVVFLPSFSSAVRSSFKQPDWDIRKSVDVEDPTIDQEEMRNIAQGTHNTISDQEWNEKLKWILHFPERSEYSTPLWYTLKLIQFFINWILGILSFVALMYMLYCWFLVFSSWSDDKNMQKGKKWISTAAIALAWIWLSWLIISAMIWFINGVTKVN